MTFFTGVRSDHQKMPPRTVLAASNAITSYMCDLHKMTIKCHLNFIYRKFYTLILSLSSHLWRFLSPNTRRVIFENLVLFYEEELYIPATF